MRRVTFRPRDPAYAKWRPGEFSPVAVLLDDIVVDLSVVSRTIVTRKREQQGNNTGTFGVKIPTYDRIEIEEWLDEFNTNKHSDWLSLNERFPFVAWKLEDVLLGAPQRPVRSLRDFYAFEQHVKTANENRGREVPKEWYEIPVFYFSNHTAIYGPDDTIPYPVYTEALDYELEVACVIGKPGRDIPADKAEEHIFGYMIYNDWSARDVQRKEMAVGLGPAKAKDFANSFGPYLVTPDELADRHTGRPGVYDLEMVARVNGVERSRGNWKDLYWSFGQMIERASQDVTLQPGDVIGSGTVGTGCLLELTKGQGPWLQPGDVVELEIERLGVLRNIVDEKRQT